MTLGQGAASILFFKQQQRQAERQTAWLPSSQDDSPKGRARVNALMGHAAFSLPTPSLKACVQWTINHYDWAKTCKSYGNVRSEGFSQARF